MYKCNIQTCTYVGPSEWCQNFLFAKLGEKILFFMKCSFVMACHKKILYDLMTSKKNIV